MSVGFLGFDPGGLAVGEVFLLPEGRFGFQPVDEEGGGVEGGLSVGAGGEDEDDGVAGDEAASAVDEGTAEERPAGSGLVGDAGEGAFGHAGVVLEGHGFYGATLGGTSDGADEASDATDVGAAGQEGGDLGAGVEGGLLDANYGHVSRR